MRAFDWQKLLVTLVILALAVGGGVYLNSLEQEMTTLSVPAKDLPAYHLITASDLMTTTLPTAVLPATPILQASELVGRYTNQLITAEEVVIDAQLVPAVDEQYARDTTAVSIPATAAMTYNGRLTSGTIVTIWAVADGEKAVSILDEVLVLDVQQVEEQNEPVENAFSYVVVLGVPVQKEGELLTAVSQHTYWFTLQQK